jgi:hypothetical protein
MTAMTCALVERLQTMADPRRPGKNRRHSLGDLIVLGFCGVLAGCDDFVELATWGRINEGFFRTFLELLHGIPSHDTFTRVFAVRGAGVGVAVESVSTSGGVAAGLLDF